jgi:hypothetical protein
MDLLAFVVDLLDMPLYHILCIILNVTSKTTYFLMNSLSQTNSHKLF